MTPEKFSEKYTVNALKDSRSAKPSKPKSTYCQWALIKIEDKMVKVICTF